MDLLNKLTLTNLKLNKKRTIVTIIGIILSTALITGVATLVTSFRESIINYKKQTSGNYHYEFINVPAEDIKYISNNRNVKEYYITSNVGYSILENSRNEYKPYLYVLGFEQRAMEYLPLDLIEGRMPKSQDELVITRHIESNGGITYKVGDELTLNIGKRKLQLTEQDILDGQSDELNQNNPYTKSEIFEGEYTKTYKIVGIIDRPDYDIEPYSAPGYTVITYLDNYSELAKNVNVYTIYDNLKLREETTSQILGADTKILEGIDGLGEITKQEQAELQKQKYDYEQNETLIKWEMLAFSEATVTMLFSVAAVVIVIIIFTSVFCIRNSFQISITERIKQYGMLASIGATSKQIRKNVLYEGLILGLIGIPLGILSGLLAIFILLQVVQNILGSYLGEMTFIFKTSIPAIIISIILCGITIYLSAKKSAKIASKVSPIEAIRDSENIKIKGKNSLRVPKIISKLFGIGGIIAYKNLKRNKKKYRATVISIVVTVSVFIAMTSFFNYAFTANDSYNVRRNYNLLLYSEKDTEEEYLASKDIVNVKGIKDYSRIIYADAYVQTAELEKHFSKSYKDLINTHVYSNDGQEEVIIRSINKEQYQKFLKKLKLKYENTYDKVILLDNIFEYSQDENGKGSYKLVRVYDYEKGDKIQATFKGEDKSTTVDLEIAAVSDERPMGLEDNYSSRAIFLVSEEWLEQYREYIGFRTVLAINADNAIQVEDEINKNYGNDFYVNNYDRAIREQNSMWMVIAIFIYGFIIVISLIGVTSIFNTITTNMKLRSKEFANLKSIGMTQKEFNKMIRLESVFYCGKSLFWGIIIGIILSIVIYVAFCGGMDMPFLFPISGVLISILAVGILITVIMQYSLNKINKQNIIETIRQDNI